MAHAMIEEDPAAAKLSFLHALIWLDPASFDTTPITPASIAKTRKNIVAPFPPKPERTESQHMNIPPTLPRNQCLKCFKLLNCSNQIGANHPDLSIFTRFLDTTIQSWTYWDDSSGR